MSPDDRATEADRLALLSPGELARLDAAMRNPSWSRSGGLLQILDVVASALEAGDVAKARAIVDQMRAAARRGRR